MGHQFYLYLKSLLSYNSNIFNVLNLKRPYKSYFTPHIGDLTQKAKDYLWVGSAIRWATSPLISYWICLSVVVNNKVKPAVIKCKSTRPHLINSLPRLLPSFPFTAHPRREPFCFISEAAAFIIDVISDVMESPVLQKERRLSRCAGSNCGSREVSPVLHSRA